MFSPEHRDRLRSTLLDYAAGSQHIVAAAITGSAAVADEDRWSDIDLAFAVAAAVPLEHALAECTDLMYVRHRALHHLDVKAGPWIYRVFLLPDTLQVDIALVPAAEFRALSPAFRLVFGESQEARFPSPVAADLIGFGWLHALHARASIARGKLWQAEYMITGLRNQALALACIRHGLPPAHARGVDRLPAVTATKFLDTLIRSLDPEELSRAFRLVTLAFLDEMQFADPALAGRLRGALIDMTDPG
ncbi:MAG: hypothetical protein R2762_26080 [Bryobacteraceae bacterium]